MRPKKLLGLLAVLSRAVAAQTAPDVAEILKKVSETYKGATQYELVLDETETLQANRPPGHAHVRIVFKAPNQYRMEGVVSGAAIDDPIFEETTIVHMVHSVVLPSEVESVRFAFR
jgi:hypothetical protein